MPTARGQIAARVFNVPSSSSIPSPLLPQMPGMRVSGKPQLVQLECKVLVFAVIVAFASARSFHLQDVPRQRGEAAPAESGGPSLDPRVKKPFCNGFAGCGGMGKKRSGGRVEGGEEGEERAAGNRVANCGSENLVTEEDFKKYFQQMLVEARMWERMQEKMKNGAFNFDDVPHLGYNLERKKRSNASGQVSFAP
ncbi:unnamed protein product [Darwinula stevensoni]|uniref:Crustacean cardioactive peptide n=1 Tax=Darwinula stevensoni TaxID=69355 RepID=A0A7R8XCY2_9CRUS|nr:unnamed protein product [Darwinula stevensoni]CAG0893776.1 unnamed protein product [Darwinula stevensoni]